MPRPQGSKNKKPRVDLMKAKPIKLGEPVKSVGGMAHSLENKGDMWGGKKPPYPRSELTKQPHGGMTLIK